MYTLARLPNVTTPIIENTARVPLILTIGGVDPSGAGLQADIETCLALGCHALPITTAITVQNTRGLRRIIALSREDIRDQANYLLDDVGPIAACKIGMLPSLDSALAVAEMLDRLPSTTPVIIDPVITTSTGGRLMDSALEEALETLIFPKVTLIKPNFSEARALTGQPELDRAGRLLSSSTAKCRYALLTGADQGASGSLRHLLYRDGELFSEYAWPLFMGQYHGTGCTLSSALAAFSAQGVTTERAVSLAQAYTWRAVRAAKSVGGAQAIPHRLADLEERL